MLRGINVGGQRLIKMADLRKMFEKLNFNRVQTYLQSGNVVFASEEKDIKQLEGLIFAEIETEFGYEAPVIVLSVKTLEMIVQKNPFAKERWRDPSFLYVTFLADSPGEINREGIVEKKQTGEEIEFSETAVYLYCPTGYGHTKLNNNFLESKLKVAATTRNWKTVNELLRMATG